MTAETGRPPDRAAGSWGSRPPGVPAAVPPPSVPLAFLAAASAGLVVCGVAWIWARNAAAVNPSADPVVAAVHFGVLATLSMGLLGATHQFTPVITGRPLRSLGLARATFVTWLLASWTLPFGIATRQLGVTAAGGALASIAIVALAVNLTAPLSARGKGAPVIALRFAVAGAVLTTFLGVAFVGDRQGSWFALSGHVDLAMGVIGMFGWLGITYVGVAEKLWPMFMLAHLPAGRRAGSVAVWTIPIGAAALAGGLGWSILGLAWGGAGILAVGLGAHLVSLWAHVRHRRRRADLHLVFVISSAAWLFVGAGLYGGVWRLATRGTGRACPQGRAVHRVVSTAGTRSRHGSVGQAAHVCRPLRPRLGRRLLHHHDCRSGRAVCGSRCLASSGHGCSWAFVHRHRHHGGGQPVDPSRAPADRRAAQRGRSCRGRSRQRSRFPSSHALTDAQWGRAGPMSRQAARRH